jgi:hypothetical protein
MELHVINPRVFSRNSRLIALFTAAFICVFHLVPCVGLSSDSNESISVHSDQSAADGNNPDNDSNGPTILLGYSSEGFKQNPLSSFMYFIPLIAQTLVDRETSATNVQQIGIISYKKKVTSKSFNVVCEFEILGKGFHKNTFDSAGMIADHTDDLKTGETLANMLDYIKFEREGFCRIEVKGTIKGSTPTVTEVDLQFNARGHKSPVTIGLYDVKPKDGQYKYENRSNEVVARVNILIFKKTEETPRMGIKVASISGRTESEGFLSGLKGGIANLFIKPPKVTKLGNTTMLKFGYALFLKSSRSEERRVGKEC